MKLSHKFMLAVVALILVPLSGLTYFNMQKEKTILLQQIRQKGIVLAEVMAMTSVDAFLNFDYYTLGRYIKTVERDSDVLSASILGPDFVIKMATDINRLGNKSAVAALRGQLSGTKTVVLRGDSTNSRTNVYDIVSPIVANKEILGYVHISLTSKNALLRSQQLERQTLLFGVFVLILLIGASIILASTITRPIKTLARAAEAIASGDLSRRIDVHSGGEIGVLADAFRSMTGNLRNYIDTRVRTEKLAVLGQLSSAIAHEIRNPMEPIRGSAVFLQSLYRDDPVIDKYTTIIQEEISGLSAFLDEFLSFARPAKPFFQPTDVNSVIEETVALSLHFVKSRDVQIRFNPEPTPTRVEGDSQQLKQVFMNLILNAVEARVEGRNSVVEIRSWSESAPTGPSTVHVEFRDNGLGICGEDLSRVQEPFFTTKNDGTGLGLAICQSILDHHGGALNISSSHGLWTSIEVVLPTSTTKKDPE